MRKIYREKHDFLLGLLMPFQEKFRISGENAGLHLLLTSKDGIPEEELLAAAGEYGVKLYGINASCMRLMQDNQENAKSEFAFRNTVLLGYGALDKEEIRRGIVCLQKAWSKYL